VPIFKLASWLAIILSLLVLKSASGQSTNNLPTFDREQGTPFPHQISRAVVADGSVWVASAVYLGMVRKQDYHLYRIDAQSGRLVASAVLPHLAAQIAAGAGSVWVVSQPPTPASKTAIIRYDSQTLRATGHLPFGQFPGCKIAFGEDSLWVWDGDLLQPAGLKLGRRIASCFVARLDPNTHQEIARIPLGANVLKLAIGEGAVWALGNNAVYRIDPQTNRLAATIPLDRTAVDLAVGEGCVWLTHIDGHPLHPLRDNCLLRIDTRTNTLQGSPIKISSGWNSVAVGRGMVWVANHSSGREDGVLCLNPQTGEQVGEHSFWPQPEVAAGYTGVWLTAYDAFEPNVHPTLKVRAKDQGFLHRLVP
jgi:outer membrane protein assembly factor BamB